MKREPCPGITEECDYGPCCISGRCCEIDRCDEEERERRGNLPLAERMDLMRASNACVD